MLHVVNGLIDFVQPIVAGYEFFPGKAVVMLGHDLNRPVKVTEVDAPGAFDRQVLLVDIEVRVHGNIAIVGVLTNYNVGPGIPGHCHTFFDGGRDTGSFDDDIGAASGRHFLDGSDSFFGSRVVDVDDGIHAELPGKFQPVGRAADHN